MNILIIGSGGREHALAWKISKSPLVQNLYCAPGNPGIGRVASLVDIAPTNVEELVRFAQEKQVDLTVVGPEQPLAAGIVNRFDLEGLPIFGPSREAAALETSKIFAKNFMQAHAIPTASFRTFSYAQRFEAERYIFEVPVPIVMKADGLASGKGVIICESKERALETLDAMFGKQLFGDAGRNLVIEEYLEGEEASVFALCDGKNFVLLSSAQDHKRIFDDDQGKNTGGMGAFAPTPAVTDELLEIVKNKIITPTLAGMAADGMPYRGCLYVGLMLTETGPKVIEYNCRFGDPETQVILPLLGDDFVELALACANGNLPPAVNLLPLSAVCVVLSSGGYPDSYETGKPIIGVENLTGNRDILVFHAGTAKDRKSGELITAGGRVLGITALGPGDDLEATVQRAYRAVEKVTFDGAYYRSDIGKKGIQRIQQLQQRNRA
jgi:phosphoribosylamine--glycine ligase